MKTMKLDLPRHWAPALVNGDLSGFESDDLETIRRFTAWMLETHGACRCIDVDNDDDANFRRWHDATEFGALPCDVATFTFDVTRPKKTRG